MMLQRPRRNRKSAAIRDMVRETDVSVSSLIFPLFVVDGKDIKIPIASMPGIFRMSEDHVLKEIEICLRSGLRSFVLFPAVEDALKDQFAGYAMRNDNFYLRIIRSIKSRFPQVCLMSDVAMDPYSSDGLDQMAVLQAEAGIDIVGPSDMMDGRVQSIRTALDAAGFYETSIMSYTAKYASAYYGPFRDALDSAPKFGDKKTYQMDPANKREALSEAALDESEGADFLMVKPALCYLDIIQTISENSSLPVAAYNVSGEYAMLKAAAEKGWINYERAMPEMLLSIRRAGASIILTYFAKEFAEMTS
jgi:porphobilinogen synthase